MSVRNFLKERVLLSLKQEDDALAYWREWILFALYLPASESEVVDRKPGLSRGTRRGSETLLLVDKEIHCE